MVHRSKTRSRDLAPVAKAPVNRPVDFSNLVIKASDPKQFSKKELILFLKTARVDTDSFSRTANDYNDDGSINKYGTTSFNVKFNSNREARLTITPFSKQSANITIYEATQFGLKLDNAVIDFTDRDRVSSDEVYQLASHLRREFNSIVNSKSRIEVEGVSIDAPDRRVAEILSSKSAKVEVKGYPNKTHKRITVTDETQADDIRSLGFSLSNPDGKNGAEVSVSNSRLGKIVDKAKITINPSTHALSDKSPVTKSLHKAVQRINKAYREEQSAA